MNTPQRIIFALTLLLMALISWNWEPWGSGGISRKVWELVSDLLTVLFIGGTLVVFFSLIKRKRKDKVLSAKGE